MNNKPFTWPTIQQQIDHWKRKDAEYEAYLDDLHRRQQDPEYVASYAKWLDDQAQLKLAVEDAMASGQGITTDPNAKGDWTEIGL